MGRVLGRLSPAGASCLFYQKVNPAGWVIRTESSGNNFARCESKSSLFSFAA